MPGSQERGLLVDDESQATDGWELLTVRCVLGRGADGAAVRLGIAKTGLRSEEVRYAEDGASTPGAQLAVVDMSMPGGAAAVQKLSQGVPKCWTMALAADAVTEAEALCAGAEVVLRSPTDAEVVALWLERLRERMFQRDSTKHALERATAQARAEAIADFASSVAQQIQHPLFVADLNLRTLHAGALAHQELAELAGDLGDAVAQMHRAAVEIRSFVVPGSRALEVVRLSELVREAMASNANPHRVPVELEVVTDERAWVHREPLEMVIDRILEHAMDAAAEDNRPRVHVRIYRHAGEPRISIRDNGPPVGPECQHSLFQPFFLAHDGCGRRIGLAPCREYVARMGGALTLAPCEDGMIFRIRLQAA